MQGQGGQVEGQAPHVEGAHNGAALEQVRMVAHLQGQRYCQGV